MTLADDLIPTFQPGDKVLVTPRPSEDYRCAECGCLFGRESPPYEAIVLPWVGRGALRYAACPNCETLSVISEGHVRVRDGKQPRVVPYTWLTRIEDES